MEIVVVEDHTLFRQMLIKLCNEDYNVVGEAADGGEALSVCRKKKPEVVIMDIMIPEPDGIDVTKILLKEQPGIRVLALSGHIDTFTVYRLLKSGVLGYVNKMSEPIEVVQEAIKTVAEGKPYFTKQFAEVRDDLKQDPSSFQRILSDRELELLPLFSRGLDNNAISDEVGLKPSTVLWHRRNIMKKLQIHATTELMRYGIKNGFWHPETV
ncbi:response regulator transcription factor [Rubellicoccus peritrichatus]|uniref:Response regulator transcription factor n=1 Tax=Rubellicoccus peritrichatus TaxID=3080537 RepID=A0AAQ3LD69_9BACT|nr:response regulator transcription factor [Puniceicoccus sp. CR14]WOO39859.1 response regulator transcription factor [Puniceicoccus sp. CR14]